MAAEPKRSTTQAGATTPPARRFYYGGQAVIEGVMIRGQRFSCVAVRRPDGEIAATVLPLSRAYTGGARRIPLVRGVLVLAETLVLGTKALIYSANVSLQKEGQELGGWGMGVMLAASMAFAVALFFVLPLFVVHLFEGEGGLFQPGPTGDILSNLLEGMVRLALFLGYVWAIGYMPDIRRVFAYHGAEHMAVKAFEANDALEVAQVRNYSTAHPRCGTAFLLVVMVIAILVFAFLGRPPIFLRLLSRVVLVPVIAGLAYEVIRFSGAHQSNPLVRVVTAPSLLLQALTTRRPEDAQIQVAIHALNVALAADRGQVPSNSEAPPGESRVASAGNEGLLQTPGEEGVTGS